MKSKEEFTTWDSLPDILQATQVAKILMLSRKTVYELFKTNVDHGGIPNFDIGNSKRVEKEDLVQWIKQRKKKKQA